MVTIHNLEKHLNALLSPENYDDASYNGIQIQGQRQDVKILATGVTASLAMIKKAGQIHADALLVHHGLFWKGQDPRLIGGLASRVRHLIKNDMTLFAYHLPIDAHPELGNNAVLAQKLHLKDTKPWGNYHGIPIGIRGTLPTLPASEMIEKLKRIVGRDILHLKGGPQKIRTVAIVSGDGSNMALSASRDGIDAFITGEPSEASMHIASEEGMHILAAGHHHTETFGVQAVGTQLAEHFGLEVIDIDLPNPV